MAWANSLLEAKFRGIVFDVVKTDDEFSRSVAEHSYPYVDGSDIEDMGRGARRINVEAVFYGDDYETRLQLFLAALDQPGAGEFIHPVFGSIKNAQAVRYPVRHDAENPDQATLSIEFVESTPGNPFFDAQQSAKLKADAIAAKSAVAKTAAVSKFAAALEKLRSFSPLAGLQKLREAITGPILAVQEFANAVVANLDVLAYPRAWANDFSALVNGVLDIKEWGASVVSDWASIKATFSSLDIFSSSGGAQPEAVDTSAATAPTEEQAIAVTQATVGVFVATALADAAALAFTAIADAQINTTSNSTQTEATEIKPSEIESIASAVRDAIDGAIEHCRAVYVLEDSRAITEPLKDLALVVQEAARALIEVRPPLVQRTINAPGNMRLAAHHLYGDHDRAPELYRINTLRSPFVEAGDIINAYAI